MPDPDDRMTTWPEAGIPGTHPMLEAMARAAGVVSAAAAYLSPTRQFDEPSLEEDDWPRDLDGPETLRMVGHLADAAYCASRCTSGISRQHAARPPAAPHRRCPKPARPSRPRPGTGSSQVPVPGARADRIRLNR